MNYGVEIENLRCSVKVFLCTLIELAILVFSLPLCAPIVGFSMAYKASQQNQEMKAKNLTDINVGNSNDNKASIDDKMNNINQNEKGNINDADIGNNKGEIGN